MHHSKWPYKNDSENDNADTYRIPDVKRDKCPVNGDLLGQERRLQGGKMIFALGEERKNYWNHYPDFISLQTLPRFEWHLNNIDAARQCLA